MLNALSIDCDIYYRTADLHPGPFFNLSERRADRIQHIHRYFRHISIFSHCGAIFILAISLVDAYKNTSIQPTLKSYFVNCEAYLE